MSLYEVLIKKFGMKYLLAGYKALEGKKTVIGMGLAAGVFAAQAFGKIDKETADRLYAGIGVWTGKSFIDKLNRYQDVASGVALSVQQQSLISSSAVVESPSTPGSASPK